MLHSHLIFLWSSKLIQIQRELGFRQNEETYVHITKGLKCQNPQLHYCHNFGFILPCLLAYFVFLIRMKR